MELEEIRLTSDVKCDMADAVNELHPKLGVKLQVTILNLIDTVANTATDKANKWWVEYLESKKDDKLGYDWAERSGAPIVIITLDPLEYEDLKKLVMGGNYELSK